MPEITPLLKPAETNSPARTIQVGLTASQFAIFFGALVFAAFPQVLLGLETFVVRDYGFFAYPVAQYQRDCFWRGELPLWNPLNHCGIPFLAQWNTMPLYPPSLIYLLLPLQWSLGFFALAHLFWAGMGMYFLARRWTGNLLASSVAGLVFGFNGFSLNLLMWPSHIATFSWMPWVVLSVEVAVTSGGSMIYIAALAGALQMLAGGPETIFLTWVLCGGLWLIQTGYRLVSANSSWRASAWRFPVIVALVAALSAAQLFSFLDLAAHSQRGEGYADARWSMPSWGWANFFVPLVFGSSGKQGLFFQYGQYWTSSYYLGIGALVLALLAIVRSRHWRVWLLVFISAAGIVVATGDQTVLSRFIRGLIPQLSAVTYPVKFVVLAVFAVPLLAAFGLESLLNRDFRHTQGRTLISASAFVALVTVGVLIWAWKAPFPTDNFPATLQNGLVRLAFLTGCGALLWICSGAFAFNSNPSVLRRVSSPALLLLLWLDVYSHEPQQNPAVPPWVYTPGLVRQKLSITDAPGLNFCRVMPTPAAFDRFRTLALDSPKDNYIAKRLGLFANCNLLDSIPKVDGFFSLSPNEVGELYSALYVSKFPHASGLLDLLSVSHVTAEDDCTNWQARTNHLPLITAGQMPVFLDDTNALSAILSPGFDPRRIVVLPAETTGTVRAGSAAGARAVMTRFSAHELRFQVSSATSAMVSIAQSFYHPWVAYLDGTRIPLLRANYAFQALEVPAGGHEVVLRYEDRAFRAGAWVSGATLTLIVVWATRNFRKRGTPI